MDAESELFLLDNSLLKYLLFSNCVMRSEWVNPYFSTRNSDGEFVRAYEQLTKLPEKYYEYTRMTECTFNYILNAIESQIETNSNFRECVSPKEKLLITIRYLATGSSFRSMAFSFRWAHSTIRNIVYSTCQAIWVALLHKHMPYPTEQMLITNADEIYMRWKFPNCFGALDGKHIRIKCPQHSGTDFYNYKHYFSVILQALVDAKCKFICVEVGSYGKQSDGGVFSNSALFKDLTSGKLKLPEERALPGNTDTVPYIMVADAAYPLKTYLMRPFAGKNLTEEKEKFNRKLSTVRRLVECAFGIMSNKWRILKTEMEVQPEKVDTIVKCVCLLHNIIIDLEGLTDSGPQDIVNHRRGNSETSRGNRFTNRASTRAYDIRDKFTAYFRDAQA